jgi:hypothetical protein
MKYLLLASAFTSIFLLSAGAQASVTWVPFTGSIPQGAILGGVDGTPGVLAPLYVCRGNFGGANGTDVQPGKLIGGKCNISYSGKEIQLDLSDHVEVAVGSGHWSANSGLANALIGGHEYNGPLYVCRIHFLGQHPGKLLPNGACFIGYAGKEYHSTEYEVLYPDP